MPLTFSYNQLLYKLSKHIVRLPLLIPGVHYKHEVDAHALEVRSWVHCCTRPGTFLRALREALSL